MMKLKVEKLKPKSINECEKIKMLVLISTKLMPRNNNESTQMTFIHCQGHFLL